MPTDCYTTHTISGNTFLLASHRMFSKTDHTVAHRTGLPKCRGNEIILCVLANHVVMKLGISGKGDYKNFINT